MIDEKAIEKAGRAICIAAGYEPEEWANEVLRDRCIKYARVALNTLSPGSTGSAEGWVLVPRAALCLVRDNVGDDRGPHGEGWRSPELQEAIDQIDRAMIDAAGGR